MFSYGTLMELDFKATDVIMENVFLIGFLQ